MSLGKVLGIILKYSLVTVSLQSLTSINFTYMYMYKSISVARNLFSNRLSWDLSAESVSKLSIQSGKNKIPPRHSHPPNAGALGTIPCADVS